MTAPLALSAVGLTKDYRGHQALRGIDLRVKPGEVVGLLGPTGAGTSTTMKICAGVARPTRGQVHLAGIDLSADPVGARRLLGYVPDVGGLFPRLTGWEHLELAARLHALPPTWLPRAHELIGSLGLGDAAGRRTSTYSHGMSRKLSLAIAALPRPRLLLLDEPFDGVDPAGAVAVREIIAEAIAGGAGVLCSTHLLDASERVSDRMVVIRAGTAIAEGDADTLRRQANQPGPLEDAYLAIMAEAGTPLGAGG
ncbi:MAG TPA: ABC transporter ATP-binding protein [Mycobacteriales bacterium]|nr:ABC transporter ATP-binding protein [Mycobacteriales bacterium]